MADIRRSGLLDDFNRANETPVQPPWYSHPGWPGQIDLVSGSIRPSYSTPSAAAVYYSQPFASPCEFWGQSGGDPGVGTGWRMGMFASKTQLSGYAVIPYHQADGYKWYLRRYDNGTPTQLALVDQQMTASGYALIRRNGDVIESWMGSADAQTWTLIVSATDTTYMGTMYGFLGSDNQEASWNSFGGGSFANRPQIYRLIRGSS